MCTVDLGKRCLLDEMLRIMTIEAPHRADGSQPGAQGSCATVVFERWITLVYTDCVTLLTL